MSDQASFFDVAKSGWFIALVAATWGIVLRAILGYRQSTAKKLEERFTSLEDNVSAMQKDLSRIAGIIEERGHNGRYTWPRGHE